MKRNKASFLAALAAVLALTSCSGLPQGAGGGGGGGSTTAKVSLVLVSDTLPANIGIISFKVAISSVVLTSSTGTTSTLDLGGDNNGKGLIVDLARAQSDSIYLGTISGVPTGTNSSITVSFTSAELAFYNGTGAAITSLTPQCPASDVCVASFNTTGTPVITASQTISANTGFGIDFNLANAVTLSGTTLSVNLTNPGGNSNVISSFALPRNTSLAAGQLDLIEDFTGVATVSGTSVTIASPAAAGRGSITAASTANTVYDQDPSETLCPGGTIQLSSCVSSNQIASMDAILNSDGTFTVQEIEPLLATPVVDAVEGTVVSNANNGTQFSIIVSDIFPAASNSKIGTLNIGDPLTVNLGIAIQGGYLVDTKGLAVGGALSDFQGGTDAGVVHLGQTVAVHVNLFTAADGATAAIANNVDTVTLRWSRFIATVNNAASPEFNISTLPGYFGFTQGSTFDVETYVGTQGTDGITNLDMSSASPSTANLTPNSPVAVRALFLENNTNSEDPPFYAAKVRQQ
ncbi:MAG: hypothetical protein WBE13_06900 [Candidatus Acidiferrum sp.]